MDQQKLSVGRIVHYVTAAGKHRPAVVVQVWSETCCNLQVFLDGGNDASGDLTPEDRARGMAWKTSVSQDEGGSPNSWHWPERV